MLNGRKTIGVLLFDLNNDYQVQLSQALAEYADAAGYNILFFSGSTIYGVRSGNALGEFNIIHLIPYEDLDALIVCYETIFAYEQIRQIDALIDARVTCPVISIKRHSQNHYNILAAEKNAILEMITHFRDVHHFDRIAFMAGPAYYQNSIQRLNEYKAAMKQLNLPYTDAYIFDGEFRENDACEAFLHYVSLNPLPQAVLCSNDQMALALSRQFILHGYAVPDDIAIAGFDNIPEAAANFPPLATCAVPVGDIGKLAITIIQRVLAGESLPKDHYVQAVTVFRDSCGCICADHTKKMIRSQMLQQQKQEQLLALNRHNTYLSISLENLENTDQLGSYLQLIENPGETKDFYLCLGDEGGSNYPHVRLPMPGFASRSRSIYSLREMHPVETSSFDTRQLLPPEALRDTPMSVFFFPIHYLQYNFGYAAAIQESSGHANPIFYSWLSIVGNTLERLLEKQKKQTLLNELNSLYIHDALTGLYNRRGFEQLAQKTFEQTLSDNKKAMVLCIDIDNLKTINDVYGHTNGDLALRTIAEAMRTAGGQEEICARVGGDEFEVFAGNYSDPAAKNYIARFQQYLDDFNKTSGLPYQISASLGYSLVTASGSQSLEFYVKLSDDRLYEQKRSRKAKCGDLSLRHTL